MFLVMKSRIDFIRVVMGTRKNAQDVTDSYCQLHSKSEFIPEFHDQYKIEWTDHI